MLKILRRFVAGAAASIAMQPASQAAPPAIPLVSPDTRAAEAEARRIEEHPMAAVGVRAEYLAAYDGPRFEVSADFLARNQGAKRFRNAAMDPGGARQELEQFIQERTR